MKRLPILFLFLFLIQFACTKINTDSYKQEFDKNVQKGKEGGFDILPFPGEFPSKVEPPRKDLGANALNNWGEDLLCPDSIRARLVRECKYKVVVKIFDTGGHSNHSFLQQGQLPGKSYTGEASLEDGNGHGTHVAGIIVGNDGLGVLDGLVDAGLVTWKPVKILTDAGSGQFSWVTAGVRGEDIENRSILASGAFVVCNGSFGGGTTKLADTEAALKASTDLGVLYCFAAGNTGVLGVNYPGNSAYGIGVGSLDQNPFQRSSYSTFGPEVWNAEPGRSIYSTYKGNAFATLSGTSMATPFQTALVAIAKSRWGSDIKDLATMRQYLAWVATDLPPAGKDDNTGYGWIAVRSILNKNPKDMPGGITPPPPPPTNPPPADGVHPARNISFNFTGEFPTYWSFAGPGTIRSAKANKTVGLNLNALNKLTVTRIEVRRNKSAILADAEYLHVKDDVNWYFTTRGLGLADGSDYADATYWTAYFFELVMQTQRQRDYDVLRIEAKDQIGNTVVLDYSELKHWPLTN